MSIVFVLPLVKSTTRWISDLLEIRGCSTAITENVDESSRLLCFVRFDPVVAGVPSQDVQALAITLQSQNASKPSSVIIPCAPAAHLAVQKNRAWKDARQQ